MNIFKKKKCQAWAKSTKNRCTNDVRWYAKYCWHHKSKIPITIVFVIGIITSLIIPKIWEHYFPPQKLVAVDKKTDLLPKMANDVEFIKDQLAKLGAQEEKELTTKFPKGYQLFGIINKIIIPSQQPTSKEIKISWSTAKILNVTKDSISIMLPDAILPGNNKLESNTVVVKNQEGLVSGGHIVINGWSTYIKIIKSDEKSIIAAVGYVKIK